MFEHNQSRRFQYLRIAEPTPLELDPGAFHTMGVGFLPWLRLGNPDLEDLLAVPPVRPVGRLRLAESKGSLASASLPSSISPNAEGSFSPSEVTPSLSSSRFIISGSSPEVSPFSFASSSSSSTANSGMPSQFYKKSRLKLCLHYAAKRVPINSGDVILALPNAKPKSFPSDVGIA